LCGFVRLSTGRFAPAQDEEQNRDDGKFPLTLSATPPRAAEQSKGAKGATPFCPVK
jgi:hypothetical protein